MTEEIKQKIQEQIDLLPKDSQKAIASFDWMKESQNIAKTYNLFDEEVDDLIIEIGLLISGVSYPDEFTTNIEDEVGTTKEDAGKISNEVLEKILKPIAKKREEIIKQNIKNNPQPWDKEMKFVLSGGDYSHLGDRLTSEALREGINKNIVI
jgi:hypothetical protein